MQEDRLVALGKVGRPHGVRGEVRLFLFNDQSRVLAAGMPVVVHTDGGDVRLELESVRYADKCALGRFKGYDREGVDRFKNYEFSVPYALLPELEEDEYYHIDLIGLPVFVADAEDVELGVVDRFFDTGVDDVMVVRTATGELFVPMLEDAIADIDVRTGRVVLHPLDRWSPAES